MTRKLLKTVDTINGAIKAILGIFLMIMSAIIIIQVVFRFILHAALPWSEELTRYLMIYIVFFGAAYAVRYNKLMRVEFVETILPQKAQKWYFLLMNAVLIFTFLVITIAGFEFTRMALNQRSPGLHVRMAYVYVAIPISGILMMVNSLALTIEKFINERESKNQRGEVAE